MFYTATVVDNVDETCSGVIEVYVPAIMTKQKKGANPEKISVKNKFEIQNSDLPQSMIDNVELESRNSIPAYPFSMGGGDHGIQLIPEVGDRVMIFFKDNNYSVAYYMYANPYIKGARLKYEELIDYKEHAENPAVYMKHKVLFLSKNKDLIMVDETSDFNGILIKSSGGHKIKMTTTDDSDGFIIETAKGHQIMIDDTNEGMFMKSAKGHSFIIDDAEGGINIKTSNESRLTIDDNKKLIQIVSANGIGLEFDDNNNKLRIDSQDTEITTKGNLKGESQDAILFSTKNKFDIKANEMNTEVQSNYNLKANSNISMEGSSKVELKAGQLEITVNGAAKIKSSGNIEIESSGACKVKGQMVTVDGQQISLGEGAASQLLKGTEFLTLFNTHTHTAPPMGGPTTPPTVPLQPTVLSQVVKTK